MLGEKHNFIQNVTHQYTKAIIITMTTISTITTATTAPMMIGRMFEDGAGGWEGADIGR